MPGTQRKSPDARALNDYLFIGRVIRDGMIRTAEEQRAGIERMETRRRLPGRRRGPKPRILVDTDTAEVTVGDKTVSIDALLAALKEAGALP